MCSTNNLALHDPQRPTFGQLSPLLDAFMGADGNSHTRSSADAAGVSSDGGLSDPAGSLPSAADGSGGSCPVLPDQQPLVIAHNGGFDARMLLSEWRRRGLPVPREWR